MELLFPFAFFLLVPGFIALALYLQHQRVKAIQAWAARTGWTYVGTDPSLVGRWRGQPFNAGHSRRVSELVIGRLAGRQAKARAGRRRQAIDHHALGMRQLAGLDRKSVV